LTRIMATNFALTLDIQDGIYEIFHNKKAAAWIRQLLLILRLEVYFA